MRILRGVVRLDGRTVPEGKDLGYTVDKPRDKTGIYDITFSSPFAAIPTASVTQVYNPDKPDSFSGEAGDGGRTTDNALIVVLLANKMRVKTSEVNGYDSNRDFSFIVIGPR